MSERSIDSADYKMTFYGILNADGDFWTPLAFDSKRKARQHIEGFFADSRAAMQFLTSCQIVPVRIVLTQITEPRS
jgi:hypothetical protein